MGSICNRRMLHAHLSGHFGIYPKLVIQLTTCWHPFSTACSCFHSRITLHRKMWVGLLACLAVGLYMIFNNLPTQQHYIIYGVNLAISDKMLHTSRHTCSNQMIALHQTPHSCGWLSPPRASIWRTGICALICIQAPHISFWYLMGFLIMQWLELIYSEDNGVLVSLEMHLRIKELQQSDCEFTGSNRTREQLKWNWQSRKRNKWKSFFQDSNSRPTIHHLSSLPNK